MFDSLINMLFVGGPIVAVLAIMSIVTTALVLYKALQFLQLGLFWNKSSRTVELFLNDWATGQKDIARHVLREQAHPQLKILEHASQCITAGKLKRPALIEELQRYGLQQMQQLQRGLRPIEVIATLAPLIGLLGTVTGMITAFQAMEAAGKQVDPSVLSGGIWQALLTTAVGLVVAIPASLFHSWLERKAESTGQQMADSLGRLLTLEAEQDSLLNNSASPFPRAVPKVK